MENTRWILWIRGQITDEVRMALANAGLELTGMGHGGGAGQMLVDRYGVYVDAPSAPEAVQRAQAAVEAVPVYVDASSVKPATA